MTKVITLKSDTAPAGHPTIQWINTSVSPWVTYNWTDNGWEPASGQGEQGIIESMVNTTYSNLVNLRNNNQLVPGTQYRITDYSTTTSQPDTLSAGHGFDIIVVADSTNKLNENARAVQRVGDTYFNSSKMEAWQLKYSLDNDTTRFEWADEVNGKGVIYRMIDELNNDCPYDFKNIQFKRKLTDGVLDLDSGTDTWVYTFTISDLIEEKVVDVSLKQNPEYLDDEGQYRQCSNNIIKEAIMNYLPDGLIRIKLNDNVFLNVYDNNVDFSYYGCHSNTFGNGCFSNTFGNSCRSNALDNGCSSNAFGNSCHSNTFGNYCSSNTFGNSCLSNTFGGSCSSNTFGNSCRSNTFGNSCHSNTFDNNCSSNAFGNGCTYNIVGALLKYALVHNAVCGVSGSNRKDWTTVTDLYDKKYCIEISGFRAAINTPTTNTWRYYDATGTEVKGTF